MKKIILALPDKKIPIIISDGVSGLTEAVSRFAKSGKILVVTNPAIKKLYDRPLTARLRASGAQVHWAEIPSGEPHKTIETVGKIHKKIAALRLDRSSLIVAFGGGVVGDIAGFAAATIFRGVRYVQVPTTLLAMVDSSVGGKVGVDLAEGKNLVGAFWQPEFVWIASSFLKSLPPKEIKSGLGEIVKYAVVADSKLFDYLEKTPLARFDWQYVMERCLKIKSAVVAKDERETKGVREILNFGHTYAHALEKATGYSGCAHGEAVALGVLKECALAKKLCGFAQTPRVKALIEKLGLPSEEPPRALRRAVAAAIFSDKKIRDGRISMILPRAIGASRRLKIPVAKLSGMLSGAAK